MTILFISVLVLWMVLCILEDVGFINGNSWLWHASDAWTRGVLSFYVSFLFFKEDIGKVWQILSTTLFINACWWILFDIGINIARSLGKNSEKLPLFYIGSSPLDLAFKKYSKRFGLNPTETMLVAKLILLVICSILLYITA